MTKSEKLDKYKFLNLMNLYTLQDTDFCEEASRTGQITPGQRTGGETNKAKGVMGEVVDDRTLQMQSGLCSQNELFSE